MNEVSHRTANCGMELAAEKNTTFHLSRFTPEPNDSFEFLGFEFRWVKRRSGKRGLQRTTAPDRLRRSVQAFTAWIRRNRNLRIGVMMEKVAQKLRGYWNYDGVRGNYEKLAVMLYHCRKAMLKWLNRRSQRRSYTVQGFNELLRHYHLLRQRITEPLHQPTLSL